MTNLTKAIAALTVVAGLGVASLPFSSHAATSGTTDISVSIAEVLSITSEASEVSGTLTNAGPVVELKPGSGKAGFTVTTNHSSGYSVSIKGTGSCTGDVTVLCNNNDDTIAAGATSVGSSAWSYKGGKMTSETAITAGGATIYDADAPTDGTTVDVQYFASASADQAAGTYTGQATYTVSTK